MMSASCAKRSAVKMSGVNQSINCLRYRNFTIIDDKPYCTLTDHECKFKDHSQTAECRMYSSAIGETVENLPRCTRPDITDKFSSGHLHDMDVKSRRRA